MEHKINDFPQYRRLKNGKAFYRIVNNLHFTEVQLIGEFCVEQCICRKLFVVNPVFIQVIQGTIRAYFQVVDLLNAWV